MVSTRSVVRLGVLAVGLGVGVGVAHSPGVASADSSSDFLSSIDSVLAGSALPAPSSGLDLAISYDGYPLFQEGSASAQTTTGDYSLAIAEGDDADATAYGTGNTAIADGDGATAFANAGTGDYAWPMASTQRPALAGSPATLARITTPPSTSATTTRHP
jgi:hypothetical protein